MQVKDSDSLPHYPTLESLLTQYATPKELAEDIDQAMLLMVVLMHHEPARAQDMAGPYQSLWEIRNLILNQIKN